MPEIIKKVVKPVDVYGYKFLVEVSVDVQNADPEKEVGRFSGWLREMIIKKVLSKVEDMGIIKVNVKAQIVKDPSK